MTEKLRHKLFDFETIPPSGVWEHIVSTLESDNGTNQQEGNFQPKSTSIFNIKFFSIAAATAAIVFICFLLFKKNPGNAAVEYSSSATNNKGGTEIFNEQGKPIKHHDAILQIPKKDEIENTDSDLVAKNTTQAGDGPTEQISTDKTKEETDVDPELQNENIKTKKIHSYITIKGLEGEPVKVSSKVAPLFVSTEAHPNPDPKWDKKVAEWKKAMLSNTLAATPGNFLDIVELTNTLTDN